jgi:CBS domain containing-hemolysin-like protein
VPGYLLAALAAFMGPPAAAAAAQVMLARTTGVRWPDRAICIHWFITAAVLLLCYLIIGFWPSSIAAAASAVLAVLWYWWRRKRRRLLTLLAGKYKYIRDAMVRVMRERARPRPVFRPAPGAAR